MIMTSPENVAGVVRDRASESGRAQAQRRRPSRGRPVGGGRRQVSQSKSNQSHI